ncbi:hypothetical protein, partial [Tetragenococcus halophilus]
LFLINFLLKNWRRSSMVSKEEAQKILDKYERNYAVFSRNASRKEFRTVLKYVAEESNRKQRKIAGLDK